MTASTCLQFTTRQRTAGEPPDEGPALVLGPDTYLPLGRVVTSIGRRHGCDLQLDEHSVAARHALVLHTPVGVVLLDDRSTSGTFVNGERTRRAVLESGDQIRVGDVVLGFVDGVSAG